MYNNLPSNRIKILINGGRTYKAVVVAYSAIKFNWSGFENKLGFDVQETGAGMEKITHDLYFLASIIRMIK